MRDIRRTENTIAYNNGYGTIYHFKKVDKIPDGFKVWAIPEIAPDVVPLCQTIRPNDPKCYDVNQRTLLFLEIEPEKAEILRDAAHAGGNLKGCKRKAKSKDLYTRNKAIKAISIFESLEG